jgi:hypothetical protein
MISTSPIDLDQLVSTLNSKKLVLTFKDVMLA